MSDTLDQTEGAAEMQAADAAPPVAPEAPVAAPPPPPLPVIVLQGERTPDQYDVIIDNVIVGRHSDDAMRDAILAANTPLLERVKQALAPI